MNYGNYPDLSGVKKVLIVKMRHHGDVLLTSPVFSVLQEAFPNAKIDAYLYKDTAPMLEGHPAISKFFLYDRAWKKLSFFKKLQKEITLLRAIRKEKYDLVINLTEGDRGAIVAMAAKAKVRVGFDPGNSGFLGKKKSYTHIVKNCPFPRHTVERQLDALRRIGIFPSEERDLHLSVPENEAEKIEKTLLGHGIEKGSYFLLHPASRWRFKCWPKEKFTALIETLHLSGQKVVISSGPDEVEKKMVEEILSPIPHIPVLDLGGKTSLKGLAALVKMAKCLVCVDSVPLHMASALKTPVVVIFGPTSEKNWGPWRHPRSFIAAGNFACRPCNLDGCGGSKKSDCLTSLPLEAVLRGIEELEL